MSSEVQHRWWEEGCYCPLDKCVCGTSEDPFVIEKRDNEMPCGTKD